MHCSTRGREVTKMVISSQVYKQVLNKDIEDKHRKANAHIILEFNQYYNILREEVDGL